MAVSPALRKLDERLREVELLLGLCTPGEATLRQVAVGVDAAILRGALVLLCSHIEGYFEDLICDVLHAYQRFAQRVGQVPPAIRARQVIGKPDRWNNPDPLKRWDTLQQCLCHALIYSDSALAERAIDSTIHTDGFANPGTGEIEYLFIGIGIDNVWARFTALEPDKLIKDSVNAIVHRRNQIAHGNMESIVTRSDVEVYLIRTRRVAEVMDSLVESEIGGRLQETHVWASLEDQ